MPVRDEYPRPLPWAEHRAAIRHAWAIPLHRCDWTLGLLAHYLSRWALLEVLKYLGTFSVLIAVIFYFAESGDRKKQKHYQAWQVINTAQGKGGSGGRVEALQELNDDHESLVGVNASGAALQGLRLKKANLLRCNFEGADLRDSVMASTNLQFASLSSANFRNSDLRRANLRNADLSDADLNGAHLGGADLAGADFTNSDLRFADLADTRWEEIKAIDAANIYGVRNAPKGFIDWALRHKAVSEKGTD